VRHQNDVFEREQTGMNMRLVLVHVEAGALDDALAKGPGQSLFVYDRSARCVDQIRRSLHARQRRAIDQMPGLRRQRDVKGNHVRRGEQLIQRHALVAGYRTRRRVVIRDSHPEVAGLFRDDLADPAEPDDAKLSIADL
jgi:hypothetical protein